jgi:hypothetical protein
MVLSFRCYFADSWHARDGRQKSVHAAVVSAAIRAGIGALRGSAPGH